MSTTHARDAFNGHRQASSSTRISPAAMLAELHVLRDAHPMWSGRLFRALASGALDGRDLAYIFAQYQLYSKSFTRFLSAVMANLDSDLFRAQLAQNLWEEGGGCEPAKRHAELFRRFLRDGLGVTPEDVEFETATQLFVREYLAFCLASDGLAGAAFLSLGTEGIVRRMYLAFVEGLRHAGLRDEQLEFFHLHIACDDDHAETLEQIMLSYAGEPRWLDVCKRAMTRALDLRHAFFEHLIDGVQGQRVRGIVERINAGVSLAPRLLLPTDVRHTTASDGPALYATRDDDAGIEFTVTRIPLTGEVLDPRRLEIPPGKCNERHRHAHETFLHCVAGTGIVLVDDRAFEVSAGDSVLVPRWAVHQTRNTGDVPLQFLAITDYRLTKRAFVGDAKAYRKDEAANQHRSEA